MGFRAPLGSSVEFLVPPLPGPMKGVIPTLDIAKKSIMEAPKIRQKTPKVLKPPFCTLLIRAE